MTTSTSELPLLESLLPHAAPMLLLDALEAHGPDWIHCVVTPRHAQLFTRDGGVPAAIAIEYMAQSVGALAGLRHRDAGMGPKIGYLIGCRRMLLHVEAFAVGERLDVRVQTVWQDGRTGQFDCRVQRGDACVAEATLTVHEPSSEGEAAR